MTVQVTGINKSTGAPYSATAAGNGTTDDTTVLQTAINTCGLIKLPAGTYRITSTLTFPTYSFGGGTFVVAGGGIIGAGSGSTTIKADFTNGTAIQANSSVTGHCLTHRGYKVTRVGTPTANSYGLDIGSGTTLGVNSPDKVRLDDLILDGHYHGLRCSSTGWSRVTDVISQNNLQDGIHLVAQWQTKNVQALNNGNFGFYIVGVLSPNGNSMGNYRGLTATGNGSHGAYIGGLALTVRMIDCHFNSNSGDGVYCDNTNNGVVNAFTNCTANSNAGGIGWYFGTASGHNMMWGCQGDGQNYGVYAECVSTSIINGHFNNNTTAGIDITTGKSTVYGPTLSGNGTGLIAAAAVTNITVAFTDASGSTTPFNVASAGGVVRTSNNPAP